MSSSEPDDAAQVSYSCKNFFERHFQTKKRIGWNFYLLRMTLSALEWLADFTTSQG